MEEIINTKKTKWVALLSKYATFFALLFVCIIFTFVTVDFRFIQPYNILNVLRQISILSIVALGMTFALAVGEIDLSVGSVIGFSCVLAVGLMKTQGLTLGVTVLLVFLAGAGIGSINAFITTFSKIPSIIVTLGMTSIITGVIHMYSGGKAVYGISPKFYQFIGQSNIAGIPVLVIIMIIFILVTYFILNKTLAGRYIYATGGNQQTARLSGINTRKLKIIGMMICSVFAAFAGILMAARLASGQPQAGASYTLEALSAVFIGMTTIRLGRANVIGTIIGVALLGVLSNGLNLLGLSYFTQDMAKGAVMIAAVAISASRTNLKLF